MPRVQRSTSFNSMLWIPLLICSWAVPIFWPFNSMLWIRDALSMAILKALTLTFNSMLWIHSLNRGWGRGGSVHFQLHVMDSSHGGSRDSEPPHNVLSTPCYGFPHRGGEQGEKTRVKNFQLHVMDSLFKNSFCIYSAYFFQLHVMDS